MSNGRWNGGKSNHNSSSFSDRHNRYYDNNDVKDRNRNFRFKRDNPSQQSIDSGRVRKFQKSNQRYPYSRYHNNNSFNNNLNNNSNQNLHTQEIATIRPSTTQAVNIESLTSLGDSRTESVNHRKYTESLPNKYNFPESPSSSKVNNTSPDQSDHSTLTETLTAPKDITNADVQKPNSNPTSPAIEKIDEATNPRINSDPLIKGRHSSIEQNAVNLVQENIHNSNQVYEENVILTNTVTDQSSDTFKKDYTPRQIEVAPTEFPYQNSTAVDLNSSINQLFQPEVQTTRNSRERKKSNSSLFIPKKKNKLKTLLRKPNNTPNNQTSGSIREAETESLERVSTRSQLSDEFHKDIETCENETCTIFEAQADKSKKKTDCINENVSSDNQLNPSKLKAALSSLISKRPISHSTTNKLNKTPDISTKTGTSIKPMKESGISVEKQTLEKENNLESINNHAPKTNERKIEPLSEGVSMVTENETHQLHESIDSTSFKKRSVESQNVADNEDSDNVRSNSIVEIDEPVKYTRSTSGNNEEGLTEHINLTGDEKNEEMETNGSDHKEIASVKPISESATNNLQNPREKVHISVSYDSPNTISSNLNANIDYENQNSNNGTSNTPSVQHNLDASTENAVENQTSTNNKKTPHINNEVINSTFNNEVDSTSTNNTNLKSNEAIYSSIKKGETSFINIPDGEMGIVGSDMILSQDPYTKLSPHRPEIVTTAHQENTSQDQLHNELDTDRPMGEKDNSTNTTPIEPVHSNNSENGLEKLATLQSTEKSLKLDTNFEENDSDKNLTRVYVDAEGDVLMDEKLEDYAKPIGGNASDCAKLMAPPKGQKVSRKTTYISTEPADKVRSEKSYKRVISKLKTKMTKMKNEKITMEKQISGLSGEILNYELKVSTLIGKISDIDNDRRGLEKAYDSLCSKLAESDNNTKSESDQKPSNTLGDSNSNSVEMVSSDLLSLEKKVADRIEEYRRYTKLLADRQKTASYVPVEDLQVSMESPLVKELKDRLVVSRKEVIQLQRLMNSRALNLNSYLKKVQDENKLLRSKLIKSKEYFASVAGVLSKSNESITKYKIVSEEQAAKILELNKRLKSESNTGQSTIENQELRKLNSHLNSKVMQVFKAYNEIYGELAFNKEKVSDLKVSLLKEQNSNSELAKVINQQNNQIKILSQNSNDSGATNSSESCWKNEYERLLQTGKEEARKTQIKIVNIHKNYLKLIADKEKGYQEVLRNLTSGSLSTTYPVNNFAQLPNSNIYNNTNTNENLSDNSNGVQQNNDQASLFQYLQSKNMMGSSNSQVQQPTTATAAVFDSNSNTNRNNSIPSTRYNSNIPPINQLNANNNPSTTHNTMPQGQLSLVPSTVSKDVTTSNICTNKWVQTRSLSASNKNEPDSVVPHYSTYLPSNNNDTGQNSNNDKTVPESLIKH